MPPRTHSVIRNLPKYRYLSPDGLILVLPIICVIVGFRIFYETWPLPDWGWAVCLLLITIAGNIFGVWRGLWFRNGWFLTPVKRLGALALTILFSGAVFLFVYWQVLWPANPDRTLSASSDVSDEVTPGTSPASDCQTLQSEILAICTDNNIDNAEKDRFSKAYDDLRKQGCPSEALGLEKCKVNNDASRGPGAPPVSINVYLPERVPDAQQLNDDTVRRLERLLARRDFEEIRNMLAQIMDLEAADVEDTNALLRKLAALARQTPESTGVADVTLRYIQVNDRISFVETIVRFLSVFFPFLEPARAREVVVSIDTYAKDGEIDRVKFQEAFNNMVQGDIDNRTDRYNRLRRLTKLMQRRFARQYEGDELERANDLVTDALSNFVKSQSKDDSAQQLCLAAATGTNTDTSIPRNAANIEALKGCIGDIVNDDELSDQYYKRVEKNLH